MQSAISGLGYAKKLHSGKVRQLIQNGAAKRSHSTFKIHHSTLN